MPGHLTLMYGVKSLFISGDILQKASELVLCSAQSLSLYKDSAAIHAFRGWTVFTEVRWVELMSL